MRLPDKYRAKEPGKIRPHERPLVAEIVRAVHKYRWLTKPLVEMLFFPSGDRADLLKRMFDHGYLARCQQRTFKMQGSKPYVYCIPVPRALWVVSDSDQILSVKRPATAEHLQETFNLDELALKTFLYSRRSNSERKDYEHELLVNYIQISMELGAQAHGWKVRDWIGEQTLKKPGNFDRIDVKHRKVGDPNNLDLPPLIHDGYGVVAFNGDLTDAGFFIEADNNHNLHIARWKERVKLNLIWYGYDGYYRRYKQHSLRILTVSSTLDRVEKMKQKTEEAARDLRLPGLAPMFWYTTLSKLNQETFFTSPIWHLAGKDEPQAIVAEGDGLASTKNGHARVPDAQPNEDEWYDMMAANESVNTATISTG